MSETKEKIEVTKKAKLAILAGFEKEKKTEEKFQRIRFFPFD